MKWLLRELSDPIKREKLFILLEFAGYQITANCRKAEMWQGNHHDILCVGDKRIEVRWVVISDKLLVEFPILTYGEVVAMAKTEIKIQIDEKGMGDT